MLEFSGKLKWTFSLLSASQTAGATAIKKSNTRVSHVLKQDIRYSWSLANVEKSEYRTRIHFTCSKWRRESFIRIQKAFMQDIYPQLTTRDVHIWKISCVNLHFSALE